MKSVKIYADYKGRVIDRTAYSQQQAVIIMNQLEKDGCINVRCDFGKLDALPKGAMIL